MKLLKWCGIIGMLTIMAGCAVGNSGSQHENGEQTQMENQEIKENESAEKIEKPKEEEEINETPDDKPAESLSPEDNPDKESKSSKPPSDEPEVVEDPGDIRVLVNKQHLLPEDYEPADLTKPDVPFYFEEDLPKRYMREEAAAALESLFQAAESEGLNLVGASGYRAYERQKQIYESHVASKGQEAADKVSAFPGASEHQTGLAIDVTSAEMGYGLDEAFGSTEEGQWLADHAHQYGFIIRYPEGRTEDTGYQYEPWHLRYVGEEAAKEIYQNDLVLEEYVLSN